MSESDDKRRDEILTRMLNTPPEPRKDKRTKGGKPEGKPPQTKR